MKFFKARSRNDDGLTLIELVVGMFVFGLVSTLIMSVFMTTNDVARKVATDAPALASVQLASQRLAKEIRNSSSFRITEDGQSLTLIDFEEVEVTWMMTDDGLDNGSYIHEPIKTAKFSYVDGLIEAHLKAGASEVTVGTAPRVKPEGGVVDTGAGITAGQWTSEGDEGTLTIH